MPRWSSGFSMSASGRTCSSGTRALRRRRPAACSRGSRCSSQAMTTVPTSPRCLATMPPRGRASMGHPAGTRAAQGDRARFYTIHGRQLPSVTTILDVIAKPALGPWYAKEERRYFEAAMLEVLGRPGARDPEYVLSAVAEAEPGAKMPLDAIGTAVHAGIEWHLRTRL